MNRRSQKIIGINPGTRYLGIAVLDGSELLDWRIKVLEGKWSEKKIKKAIEILSDIFDQYEPNVLVIKKLHPSRRSKSLARLVVTIKALARRKEMKVYQYSIKKVEDFFVEEGKLNKRNLAEAVISKYPVLSYELNKEKRNKNSYYIRAIEATALAASYLQEHESY